MPERINLALAANVVLTRTFHAPRALVWQVCDRARDHLAKWWGPHTFSNPLVEIDLRPGGALRVDMQGPDGVNAMTGQVREVVAPERFVFTSLLESDGHTYVEVLNTVTLTEQQGVTTVTLVARVLQAAPEAFEDLGGMHEGWRQSFERLEDQVATSASEDEMVVSRLLNAPRELVFDVWTDPRHLGEWWGPVGFTTTTQHMDLRPGGEWIHVMHGPDGIDYPNHTVFIEVNRCLAADLYQPRRRRRRRPRELRGHHHIRRTGRLHSCHHARAVCVRRREGKDHARARRLRRRASDVRSPCAAPGRPHRQITS